MKSRWKTYLLYGGLILVGVGVVYLIVETIQAKNTGFETKTLWDWMNLLIIPLVLSIGAFLLNKSERLVEREIAKDRQREIVLQNYIKEISKLLLDNKLYGGRNKKGRDIARTLTLNVLRNLDDTRKGLTIKFLYEAHLIEKSNPIIDLDGANLEDADLESTNLESANFHYANLTRARLNGANLKKSILSHAVLNGANLGPSPTNAVLRDFMPGNLVGAVLEEADLSFAKLYGANLELCILKDTNLMYTELKGANLWHAKLHGANLQGADITDEQLASAGSLTGATMPDGTIHE